MFLPRPPPVAARRSLLSAPGGPIEDKPPPGGAQSRGVGRADTYPEVGQVHGAP